MKNEQKIVILNPRKISADTALILSSEMFPFQRCSELNQIFSGNEQR